MRHAPELAGPLRAALESFSEDERPAAQAALANRILEALPDVDAAPGDLLALPPEALHHVLDPASHPPGSPRIPERPAIPFRQSALLVNGPHDPRAGATIASELGSADRVHRAGGGWIPDAAAGLCHPTRSHRSAVRRREHPPRAATRATGPRRGSLRFPKCRMGSPSAPSGPRRGPGAAVPAAFHPPDAGRALRIPPLP
jgi:hypothetical protein